MEILDGDGILTAVEYVPTSRRMSHFVSPARRTPRQLIVRVVMIMAVSRAMIMVVVEVLSQVIVPIFITIT